MNNCTLDCIYERGGLNFDDMCTFTKSECLQDTAQFVQSYFCLFNSSFMILAFIGIPLFLLMFKTLHVIASFYLSPCMEEIIQQFKISPVFAGVTFLAFANGAPDVMTAVVAGSSNSGSTALIPFGSIFGACLFSAAFIFSTVIMLMPKQILTIKPRQIILPLAFYIISILYVICVTVFYQKMNLYLASALLGLYVIYIICVLKMERDQKKKDALLGQEQIQEQGKNQYKVSAILKESYITQKKGFINQINMKVQKYEIFLMQRIIPPFKFEQFSPINTLISLVVSPFILIATQDIPKIVTSFVGPVPIFPLICIPSILLIIYTIYCWIKQQDPQFTKPFAIYSFFVSVALLTYVVSLLINFVELPQILTGINPVFLGLTVFAGANSIGDFLTIYHFASIGNSSTAVAGIYSGQLFNYLLGFGISLFIKSLNGEYEYKIFDFGGSTYHIISDAIVMSVIIEGLIFLIFMLALTVITKGVFTAKWGRLSRYYYFAFIILATLMAILTDFFNQFSCHMAGPLVESQL